MNATKALSQESRYSGRDSNMTFGRRLHCIQLRINVTVSNFMNKGTVLEAKVSFTHCLSLQYRASPISVKLHKEDIIGL